MWKYLVFVEPQQTALGTWRAREGGWGVEVGVTGRGLIMPGL